MLYSYGKQLLAPGQRIGYIAVPRNHPDREALREALFLAQFATGFAFPNALLQQPLPDIEPLCIDLAALERKCDRFTAAMRDLGYETTFPSATFYALVRSPDPDDMAFTDRLAERGTYVLPGSMVELPGFVRVSLTASAGMLEQALQAFASVQDSSYRQT